MYMLSLPTCSKRLDAWIYSSVSVRSFALYSDDNYPWP